MFKRGMLTLWAMLLGQTLIAQVNSEAFNDLFINLRVPSNYNLLFNQGSSPDVDPGGLAISIDASQTDAKTKHGASIKVVSGSEVLFTPNDSYAGWDTFQYVIVNTASFRDTAQVVLFVVSNVKTDSVILTNKDSLIIPILANDAITANSSVALKNVSNLKYGDIKYENNIVTYYAKVDYIGQEEFSYTVCDTIYAAELPLCKNGKIVIDRQQIPIVVPGGLSPNGDLINDALKIPNIENFPKANLRIYSRLGEEVWRSLNGYNNDFIRKNLKGEDLPDGT